MPAPGASPIGTATHSRPDHSSRSSLDEQTSLIPVSLRFTPVQPLDDPNPPLSLPLLYGRSNYNNWRTTMTTVLLSKQPATDDPYHLHPRTADLLLGNYLEPIPPYFKGRTSEEVRRASWDKYKSDKDQWDHANQVTVHLIQGTLAMNVQAFVRSITQATDLWWKLDYLFGEKAGIENSGGSFADALGDMIVPVNLDNKKAIRLQVD